MITHNMHDALTLGNRTLMMDHGRIVLDIGGEEAPTQRWTACSTALPRMSAMRWTMTEFC